MSDIAAAPHALDPALWTTDAQKILLHDIGWEQYETLLEALGDHHLRLTYDRGNLEFMTLSPEHERYKHLLRRLLEVLGEALNVPLAGLGSTTYRRADLERGLEPDECYYLSNWSRVRGKKRIDLRTDPPPDLAIEIDVTHSSLERMGIYAALEVPEVWRFDGEHLRVYRLAATGQYDLCDRSPSFPTIPIPELVRFIRQGEVEDEMSMVRALREWVGSRAAELDNDSGV
jgi:Uma2 family endonuclease